MITKLICASFFIVGTLAVSHSARAEDDRSARKLTAQDQSSKPSDAELTRRIRQEVMSHDVSLQAKNVTIVTIDGMVTLKGDVVSTNEKNLIGKIAQDLAPNVRNDIAVKTAKQ